jgi:hypothetical protein
MLLYKYVNEDRIGILTDGLIRFTQPQALNDPFELKPQISDVTDWMSIERGSSQLIEEKYGDLSQDNKYRLKNIVLSLDSLPDSITKGFEMVVHKAMQEIGILSLSEIPDNLLMWAHYANSHQGFVIEFDSSNNFFNQKIGENDELRHLRKVLYSEVRPNIRINKIEKHDAGTETFLTKSDAWAYEKEWRMLLPLECSDKKDNDKHLFKIPFDSISAVIIGARASQETIEKIKEAISVNSELSHVKLCKMLIDDKRYELKTEEI